MGAVVDAEAISRAAAPSAFVDFVAGTCGGIASVVAGHPFDTIKTRLQAQGGRQHVGATSSRAPLLLNSPGQSALVPRYTSSLDAFAQIVRHEGFTGLYKGVTFPLLGVAAMNASVFGMYGMALRMMGQGGQGTSTLQSSTHTLTQIFLAGCVSGVISALITCPIDLIKIRQQLYIESAPATHSSIQVPRTPPNAFATASGIWHTQGGLRGIYRGLGVTALRDLGYGPYFLSYEIINRSITAYKQQRQHQGLTATYELSNIDLALSGGIAGMVGWASTFAVDVVKTKVQANVPGSERGSGYVSPTAFHARETLRQNGWRGFIAGLAPTMLRALPVNAALFLTFEVTKKALINFGF